MNGETVPDVILEVLSCSTAFYLDHHLNVQSLSDFEVNNINKLQVCYVRECHEITTMIDKKGDDGSIFPNLEILGINHLENLRSICMGTIQNESFSRLTFLSVHTCPRLSFVLTSSMLQNLDNLKVLEIVDCWAVTDVVSTDNNDVGSGCVVLPSLIDLRLHYLRNLKSSWKGVWPPLDHISFYNCPKLKRLPFSLEQIKSIKEIKAEKTWWDGLIWEETSLYLQLQAHFTKICYEDL